MNLSQLINHVTHKSVTSIDTFILKNLGEIYIEKYSNHGKLADDLIDFSAKQPSASYKECLTKLNDVLSKTTDINSWLAKAIIQIINKSFKSEIELTFVSWDGRMIHKTKSMVVKEIDNIVNSIK